MGSGSLVLPISLSSGVVMLCCGAPITKGTAIRATWTRTKEGTNLNGIIKWLPFSMLVGILHSVKPWSMNSKSKTQGSRQITVCMRLTGYGCFHAYPLYPMMAQALQDCTLWYDRHDATTPSVLELFWGTNRCDGFHGHLIMRYFFCVMLELLVAFIIFRSAFLLVSWTTWLLLSIDYY